MFSLNEQSRQNIKNRTGLSVSEISKMSIDEQIAWVEKRTKKNIVFSDIEKPTIIGRGNPLLSKRRFKTLEDVESESKRLFGI